MLSTFLSNEKLRTIRILNQPLKIPARSLHIAPNSMILPKDSTFGGSDSATRDWLFLQHNIDREKIRPLKRRLSIQSSCEKDNVSKKSRGCIEDHRQSAEICAKKKREKCKNNNCQQISAETHRKSCSDLLAHQEYYRSIESSCPIYSDKPVPFNDWRACVPVKCDSPKRTIISCESWVCGKPATERKVYHKCKPKSCTYPNIRNEAIKLDIPRDSNDGSEELTTEELKRIRAFHSVRQCSETKPSFSEKTCTSSEKKTSPMKMSKPCSVSDTPSLQDIHKDCSKNGCDKTYARAEITPKCVSEKHISRCVISFEDKCAASLALPVFVSRKKPRVVQQFPLTKSGRCCVDKKEQEKDLTTLDISDCNPSIAGFKYRLSKCPSVKEIQCVDVNHVSSDTDVVAQPKQDAALSVCEKIERQESRPQVKEEEKRKRFKSSNGWSRQRYKIRLKIFQKGNGHLDPCLPRIVELRQPRDGKMRSILFELDEGERLKSPCRSPDYCPSKWPVAESKNYLTKMNESKTVCGQYQKKRH